LDDVLSSARPWQPTQLIAKLELIPSELLIVTTFLPGAV